MTLNVGIVTGEPSGDLLAKQILLGIKDSYIKNINCIGIGGTELSSIGFNSLYSMNDLSVFGYLDVFLNFPKIFSIYKNIRKEFIRNKPDIFLGIDLPDFNFRLERDLKKNNIPTIHLVSPSIWAWRYNRINMIKESVSHMLVVFPFEEKIYRDENIPVTYVGHPLANAIPLNPSKKNARDFLKISEDIQLICVLPGSRSSEINNLGPLFIKVIKILNKIRPDIEFIVPMTNEFRRVEFESLLYSSNIKNIRCISARDYISNKLLERPISWDAIEASDVVLSCSGTATLEAALFKKPMVISYILSPLVKNIMKWKSGQKEPYLPWIGLPNILMNRSIVPEFVQDNATPKKIAESLLNILLDNEYCELVSDSFMEIHKKLKLDTPKLVAETIIRVLG